MCGGTVNGFFFIKLERSFLSMKVVYQTCCGIDVHKSFLVATIVKTTSGVQPSYQKKRFSTFNNSILHFKDWLIENVDITVRRSRQSGVARATCPD